MKVLVPVKRVVDFNVKVRVKADGSGVTREGRALVAAYQRIDRKLRRIVASAERELVGSA